MPGSLGSTRYQELTVRLIAVPDRCRHNPGAGRGPVGQAAVIRRQVWRRRAQARRHRDRG